MKLTRERGCRIACAKLDVVCVRWDGSSQTGRRVRSGAGKHEPVQCVHHGTTTQQGKVAWRHPQFWKLGLHQTTRFMVHPFSASRSIVWLFEGGSEADNLTYDTKLAYAKAVRRNNSFVQGNNVIHHSSCGAKPSTRRLAIVPHARNLCTMLGLMLS